MSKNVVGSASRVEGVSWIKCSIALVGPTAASNPDQPLKISVSDFLSHANVCRLAKRYEMDFNLANIDRKHLSAYCR